MVRGTIAHKCTYAGNRKTPCFQAFSGIKVRILTLIRFVTKLGFLFGGAGGIRTLGPD